MIDRQGPARRLSVAAAIAVALLMAFALTACGGAEEKRDVNDYTSLFHVKVPAEWQTTVEPGVTSIYANDELPSAENDPGALAVVVFVSESTTDVPVPEALTGYTEYWGESRGWTEVVMSNPYDVTVGSRPATRVDITGVAGNGDPFQAAYIWVRTNGREVLVTAVAPPENWANYEDDLDSVLTEWYWHRAEGASADETTTP
jgi:hypothetical protein